MGVGANDAAFKVEWYAATTDGAYRLLPPCPWRARPISLMQTGLALWHHRPFPLCTR
jgi:hypothetical protein